MKALPLAAAKEIVNLNIIPMFTQECLLQTSGCWTMAPSAGIWRDKATGFEGCVIVFQNHTRTMHMYS
jgi:hypothetical protein